MLQPPPARPGMREDEVDTPALLIDLDAFEYNLDHMAELLAPTGAKLRAHAKTHKSPVIARLQMARGAVGQCVQKVAEAEALAWGGIPDILVSNEVVGAVEAGAAGGAGAHQPRSRSAPTMRRRWRRSRPPRQMPACGCRCWWRSTSAPDAAASRPARMRWRWRKRIAAVEAPDLRRTAGLSRQRAAQAHGGGTPRADRQRGRWHRAARWSSCASRAWIARSSAAPAPARSRSKSASGVYNEIQAGSYVFMDADYARNLDEAGAPVGTFRHSLFVLATVMSAPQPQHRGGGCRTQGGGGGQRHADDLAAAGHPLCRRLGRARQAGRGAGDDAAEAGREAAAGARPLRPDGGPLRLVCRRAQRPRGVPVADRGARRHAAEVPASMRSSRVAIGPKSADAVGTATQLRASQPIDAPLARSAARTGW